MSWWSNKKKESPSDATIEELTVTPQEQPPEDAIDDTFAKEMFAYYAELIASYVELIESQHADIVRLNNVLELANKASEQLNQTDKRCDRVEEKIMIHNLRTIASYDDAEIVKEKLIEFIGLLSGERPSNVVTH